jgi:hypothetical protein
MIDYKNLLKEHECDAYVLEVEDRPVTKESAVCISPYNSQTGEWVSGMNIIIPMSEILNNRIPVVTRPDDTELNEFLKENFLQKEL